MQLSSLHCLHGLVQLAAGGRGTQTTPFRPVFIAPFGTLQYVQIKIKIMVGNLPIPGQ
jgi:hypothetical protein